MNSARAFAARIVKTAPAGTAARERSCRSRGRRCISERNPAFPVRADPEHVEKDMQKLTDDFIKEVEKIAENKEKELMEL